MNTKIFNSLVLVVCGILFCFIVADTNGKWSGNVDYNGNMVPLSYFFKVENGKVTGTSQTPLGIADIVDGKIEKDIMTFKVNINGETAMHTATVFADSINMKITYHGDQLYTTLKRSNSQ